MKTRTGLALSGIMHLCSRLFVKSCSREVAPSCSREVAPSCSREVAPSCSREFTPSPFRPFTPSCSRAVAPSYSREVAPSYSPGVLDKGTVVVGGIKGYEIEQAIELAIAIKENNESTASIPDYSDTNVSIKVIKIIQCFSVIPLVCNEEGVSGWVYSLTFFSGANTVNVFREEATVLKPANGF